MDPTRRVARVTVDLVLPPKYRTADLSKLFVEEVRVNSDNDSEVLHDIITGTVVEARIVVT